MRANPELSEAQLALGHFLWLIDWDWNAAESALRLAIDLDPSNGVAHRTLGHALSQSGRRTEAEAAMRRARELDPLDALTHALSAQVAFQNRDLTAAIDHARRAIVLGPSLWVGFVELAQAYEGAGEYALALEALADAGRFAGGNSKVVSMQGYVLAKSGRTDAAREAHAGGRVPRSLRAAIPRFPQTEIEVCSDRSVAARYRIVGIRENETWVGAL